MDTSLGGNETDVGVVKTYSGSSLVGKLFAYYLKCGDRRYKQTVLSDVVSNEYRARKAPLLFTLVIRSSDFQKGM